MAAHPPPLICSPLQERQGRSRSQWLGFRQGNRRPPDPRPRAPVHRGNGRSKDHGKGGEGGAEPSERLRRKWLECVPVLLLERPQRD